MVTLRPPQRIARVLTSFDTALMLDTVQECLEAVIGNTLLTHVTFNMMEAREQDRSCFPYAWSTYPGRWVTRYLRESYFTYDPVFRIGAAAANPFFWTELHPDQSGRCVLEDAIQYGVGPCGYTIPHEGSGMRSLLSITSSTMDQDDWHYFVDCIHPELREFTKSLHEKAVQEIGTYILPRKEHAPPHLSESHHSSQPA